MTIDAKIIKDKSKWKDALDCSLNFVDSYFKKHTSYINNSINFKDAKLVKDIYFKVFVIIFILKLPKTL